uniref:Uncharacterized protein n=1 Tax=Arundo donax TaxID=35708 RepID=A0A0A9GT22_ARUDO
MPNILFVELICTLNTVFVWFAFFNLGYTLFFHR